MTFKYFNKIYIKNGAGKTTTLSVLTGLIEMTSGSIMIYNKSLSDELQSIRQITGICPQQNVLFLNLTVIEQLSFFGKIKGLFGDYLIREVNKLVEDVGLTEKANVLASNLSGGMKRKLCLAIALIGGFINF